MKIIHISDRAFQSLQKFLMAAPLVGAETAAFVEIVNSIRKAEDAPDPILKAAPKESAETNAIAETANEG